MISFNLFWKTVDFLLNKQSLYLIKNYTLYVCALTEYFNGHFVYKNRNYKLFLKIHWKMIWQNVFSLSRSVTHQIAACRLFSDQFCSTLSHNAWFFHQNASNHVFFYSVYPIQINYCCPVLSWNGPPVPSLSLVMQLHDLRLMQYENLLIQILLLKWLTLCWKQQQQNKSIAYSGYVAMWFVKIVIAGFLLVANFSTHFHTCWNMNLNQAL